MTSHCHTFTYTRCDFQTWRNLQALISNKILTALCDSLWIQSLRRGRDCFVAFCLIFVAAAFRQAADLVQSRCCSVHMCVCVCEYHWFMAEGGQTCFLFFSFFFFFFCLINVSPPPPALGKPALGKPIVDLCAGRRGGEQWFVLSPYFGPPH